ncbi:MAG: NimC/NimA family protein [Syntrophomonadaceae bacterium]|nr:NimC/NimA family protein [Syntrophomonadaceae bacterium]
MNEVLQYLKDCGVFYLATIDADQPRVRPFGAVEIFEGKLYIITSNKKKVYAQMQQNPRIEICAMAQDNSWIRIEALAVRDDRIEARQHMLDTYPSLKQLYSADDGNSEVLWLKDATATIASFTGEPRVIKF